MTEVVTVTVNPVIDIHYYMEDFQIGRDNSVSCRNLYAAGKGMNVSRTLHSLGVSTEAVLLLGCENAADYLRLAAPYGVPLSWLSTEGAVRENISVNTPHSETRICSRRFAASPALLPGLSARIVQKAKHSAFVVFSGSLPQGITPKDFSDFVRSVRVAVPDCNIVLDCPSLNPEAISAIAPFLIKPNQEEARALLGLPAAGNAALCPEEIVLQAEKLRTLGSCTHVVISCGAAGAAYASFGGAAGFLRAPVLGAVASTVGAGDSMLAGILYGLLQDTTQDLKGALSWGIASGSAACQANGTCPPEKEAVLQLMEKL